MKPHSYIVVGLGFGDEGKGSIVDFLTAVTGAKLIVRFSGGSQCAHNVVTPDGRHHTFAQIGSGSFIPGVLTHLARHVLIEPFALVNEARVLGEKIGRDPLHWISIDPECAVITSYHWHLNRARETARGRRRNGSCGRGIGELRAWQEAKKPELKFQDLFDRNETRRRLNEMKDIAVEEIKRIDSASPYRGLILHEDNDHDLAEFYYSFTKAVACMDGTGLREMVRAMPTVFEGNQGILLDEEFGFEPYNTWTSTTAKYAKEIVADAGVESTTIGVTRTFMTRHGPGPFVSENPNLGALIYDDHNKTHEWQGPLRVGWFDAVAIRYALACCPVDEIALTHLDKVRPRSRYVAAYMMQGLGFFQELPTVPCAAATLRECFPLLTDRELKAKEWVNALEYIVGRRVRHVSWGQTRTEKKSFDLENRGIDQLPWAEL